MCGCLKEASILEWMMLGQTNLIQNDTYKTDNMFTNDVKIKTAQFREEMHVTLCRGSAKQTIPLSVLARNQTKGFLESRSRRNRKWVRERAKGVGQRSSKKAVGDRWRTGQSTPDIRETSRMRRGPEQWGKTSQDESALLMGCRIFARNPR